MKKKSKKAKKKLRQLFEFSVLVRVPIVIAAESEAKAREELDNLSCEAICRAADEDCESFEMLDCDLSEIRAVSSESDEAHISVF